MAIFTKVTLDAKKISAINEELKTVEEDFKKLGFNYSKEVVRNMKKTLLQKTKKAPRTQSANNIRAIKINDRTSVIKMPLKLIYLDRMKPHYVSLKKGRAITTWARKFYDGSFHKTGRSRVRYGKRGGISGSIYVTPDPFIDEAILRTDNWLIRTITNIFQKMNTR